MHTPADVKKYTINTAQTATYKWKLSADEAVNVILAFDEVWCPPTRIASMASYAAAKEPTAYNNFVEYFGRTFMWPEIHRRLGWGDLDRAKFSKWRRALRGFDLALREEIERRAVSAEGIRN